MPISLHEDASMCFDQVVIGVGEAICEVLGSWSFDSMVLHAHARGICVSELERGELHGQVLAIVDGELGKSQPIGPAVLFLSAEEA